jgi:MoxR-like ATPase
MIYGRDFVLPDDVKAMASAALAHRLLLKPELWMRGIQAEDVMRDILERTPIPKAD